MPKPTKFTALVLLGALLGLLFSSVSTRDFAMHLDRQVHDVTCSFTPGLSGPESGESGCLTTMVSGYSSVFRSWVWGGVPISLPAMAVFAFLIALAVEVIIARRQRDRRAMAFLALATALPLGASLIMAVISLTALDTLCKLCVGIYISSALCFAGGLGAFLSARRLGPAPARRVPPPKEVVHPRHSDPVFAGGHRAPTAEPEKPASEAPGEAMAATPAYFAAAFATGVAFVVIPVLAYGSGAPDHEKYIGTCGHLPQPEVEDELLVTLSKGDVAAIEVLDPLCPACREFERRLTDSGYDEELNRRALLFPLDNTCNWMVDSAIHPGACAVSEAMLCAGDRAPEVLEWAFGAQEDLRAQAKKDPAAAAQMVGAQFPDLASCLGSPEVKSKLNRSLRWAVSNQIQVLTPQLFIGTVKLCDEDVDLGLEFALSRMIERQRSGTLTPQRGEDEPAAPIEPEPVAKPSEGDAPAEPDDDGDSAGAGTTDTGGSAKADPAAADPADKADKTDKTDKPSGGGTGSGASPGGGAGPASDPMADLESEDSKKPGDGEPPAGGEEPAGDDPDPAAGGDEPPADDEPAPEPTDEGGQP